MQTVKFLYKFFSQKRRIDPVQNIQGHNKPVMIAPNLQQSFSTVH